MKKQGQTLWHNPTDRKLGITVFVGQVETKTWVEPGAEVSFPSFLDDTMPKICRLLKPGANAAKEVAAAPDVPDATPSTDPTPEHEAPAEPGPGPEPSPEGGNRKRRRRTVTTAGG